MRHSLLVTLAVLIFFPLAARCADMYRWVDDRGRTQVSDIVPERYRNVAKKLDSRAYEVSPQHRSEAAERAAKERARLADIDAAARQTQSPANSPSSASPPAAPAASGSECDRLWQEYRDSGECFAPFMMGPNGIKAEGFLKCKEVRSPAQKCGPMKQ